MLRTITVGNALRVAVAVALGCCGAVAGAQERLVLSPVAEVANTKPWNYGALLQGGNGVTDNRDGFHFLMAGGHVGKVLTGELGTGVLKGNFEYGAEVFPFWQSYTPKFQKVSCYGVTASGVTACSAPYTSGGTYTGVSVTPILLRWNFTHGERWMPCLQGGGGLIWTNHKYPAVGSTAPNLTENGPNANTSVWNFTPQFGIGAHYLLRSRRSLDFGFNAVHISSASLGDRNPGVNASVQASVGYSWWK